MKEPIRDFVENYFFYCEYLLILVFFIIGIACTKYITFWRPQIEKATKMGIRAKKVFTLLNQTNGEYHQISYDVLFKLRYKISSVGIWFTEQQYNILGSP